MQSPLKIRQCCSRNAKGSSLKTSAFASPRTKPALVFGPSSGSKQKGGCVSLISRPMSNLNDSFNRQCYAGPMSEFEHVESLLERAMLTGEDTVMEARSTLEHVMGAQPSRAMSAAINAYMIYHAAMVLDHHALRLESRKRLQRLALLRLARVGAHVGEPAAASPLQSPVRGDRRVIRNSG